MKTRKGLDDDHLTYLDAGRIAQEAGLRRDRAARPDRRAVLQRPGRLGRDRRGSSSTSTSRCSATATSGRPATRCGWSSRPAPPVSSSAAAASGRPWLFRDLAAAFAASAVERVGASRPPLPDPRRGPRDDASPRRAAGEHMGEERGCKEFRKHVSWYLKGFRAGGELRHSLALVDSLAALDVLLAELDPDEPFPVAELGTPRGRQGSPRERVVLPEGWLDDTDGTSLRPHRGHHRDHRRVTGTTRRSRGPGFRRPLRPVLDCHGRVRIVTIGGVISGRTPDSNSKGISAVAHLATSGSPMPAGSSPCTGSRAAQIAVGAAAGRHPPGRRPRRRRRRPRPRRSTSRPISRPPPASTRLATTARPSRAPSTGPRPAPSRTASRPRRRRSAPSSRPT